MALKPAMIGTCRLVDDPGDLGADPAHQRLVALDRVVEAAAHGVREATGVEGLFEMSTPMVISVIFCRASACHAQLKLRVSVQAFGKRRG
ncbi:hypothetical protein ASD99_04635 [Mesorhizobium sp. Root695]|nr:hypothetical protein ASD99_04635 [Mesorhizobium sp. Root695]